MIPFKLLDYNDAYKEVPSLYIKILDIINKMSLTSKARYIFYSVDGEIKYGLVINIWVTKDNSLNV